MSIITLSPMLSNIRGTIGHITFSRHGYEGQNRLVAKLKDTKKRNRQTYKQSATRSIIIYLSKKWKTLTQQQRDAWNNYALNFSSGSFWSGQNIYVRTNFMLKKSSLAERTEPPTRADRLPRVHSFIAIWDLVQSRIRVSWTRILPVTGRILFYLYSRNAHAFKQFIFSVPAVIPTITFAQGVYDDAVIRNIVDSPGLYEVFYRLISPQGNFTPITKINNVIVP